MAKAKHTYAVRLAVEGGNKVKANLTSVGTSGERSMRRIDRGSDRASRGLGTLSSRASSLRRNMRLLGGVVAGVAAAGGLALLVKRSIDAADAIAKTADAIGISTDALQELRFAADLSGVSVESLDKALKFATKAIGELRTRTSSELTTALKDFDAQLLRNIRSAGSVEEAIELVFRRMGEMEDATKKAALAKSVFGRAGSGLVNIVRGEAGALDAMRQQARDLGIVLDEELLRNAEKAKDQLTVLGTVLSANLNKAILEHAGAIGTLAEQFTESLPALIGWVSTFGKWVGLVKEISVERLAEIREEIAVLEEVLQGSQWARVLSQWLNDFLRLGPISKGSVEIMLEELRNEKTEIERLLKKWAVQPPPSVTPPVMPPVTPPGDPDDPVKTAEDRARRLLQIEKSLNNQLFQLRHQGADRIRAEHAKLETELEKFKRQLAEPLPAGGTEAEFEKVAEERAMQLERIGRLQFGAAAVRDDKLTKLARRETEREEKKADRIEQANKRVAESLGFDLEALKARIRATPARGRGLDTHRTSPGGSRTVGAVGGAAVTCSLSESHINQDRHGGGPLLCASRGSFPFIEKVFADSGYAGEKVATATVIAVKIVRKSPDQVGFAVQPRRWVVERFFAWINRNRRLAKDFEATIASARAFLYAASVMLLVRRLARAA